MKQKLTLLFIVICTLPILLSFSISKPKKSLFNGLWQFTGIMLNDRAQGGLNDSTYTETLITAPNRMMTGKTYVIKYSLKGNVMIATGFYEVPNDGVALKVYYNQTWTRVDFQNKNN